MNNNINEKYLKENPETGYLNIRAYAANSAIPITGLSVIVSKNIDNNDVVFYEGKTDDSGVISKISLPTPKIEYDNLEIPPSQDYDVVANYNGTELKFKIKIYSGVEVLQNINIVPNIRLDGNLYVS